jgi:anthranilate phosphoribosyltransferase
MTTLPGGWSGVIAGLINNLPLETSVATAAMESMLSGEATDAQIAGFLIALKAKGETADELAAMLAVVRAAATPIVLDKSVSDRAIDIVGTGGDASHSVNVSTMAGLVVAGAGVPVVKHGNRAASSSCGTADVLEALGANIMQEPNDVVNCVTHGNFGFVFAQKFHPAFRHVGAARREIGVPTVFNLLGPLANPAPIENMLVGVRDASVARMMAEALRSRGVRNAWLVHGDGGLDELAISGVSVVVTLHDGEIGSLVVDPAELGIALAPLSAIKGGAPEVNAEIVRQTLGGQLGPVRDIVVLNAGAALCVAGVVSDLLAGIEMAGESIDSGAATKALMDFVALSNRPAS